MGPDRQIHVEQINLGLVKKKPWSRAPDGIEDLGPDWMQSIFEVLQKYYGFTKYFGF